MDIATAIGRLSRDERDNLLAMFRHLVASYGADRSDNFACAASALFEYVRSEAVRVIDSRNATESVIERATDEAQAAHDAARSADTTTATAGELH